MQRPESSLRVAVSALRVLAQDPADWSGWTERLSTAIGAQAELGGATRLSIRAWHVTLSDIPATPADALSLASQARTRWVMFVTSPARHLASRLGSQANAAAAELLAAWCASATQALGVIQALRTQCVVFDSDEATSSPAAVAQCLSGWLGEDLPHEAWPVAPLPAGLMAKLALDFVQADRRAMALWSELLACCSPLPGTAGEGAAHAGTQVGSDRYLAQAQALMAATARVPLLEAAQQGLGNELEAAHRRLRELEDEGRAALQAAHETQTRLERTREQADKTLAAEIARREDAEAQAKAAQSEAALLLAQLHQVQEELESVFLQRQDSTQALAATRADLETAQQALAGAQQQLQAASEQAARHAQESERDQKEKTRLEAVAKEAQVEADLLLVQLHYVQEELETHFLALQSARQEPAAAHAAAEAAQGHLDGLGFRVLARHSEIKGARAERPHCELDMAFNDLTLGALKLARAVVRLVEHEGRAGLALVAPAEQAPPITQWAPHGEDGRGAYMLFIPDDARGREQLATLGTRNWQAVRGLAALVQQAVTDADVPEALFWQAVAARLCVALDGLPPRLRYDEMTVQPDGNALTVRLEGACFGSRTLPPVALRWAPGSREAPLKLLRTHPHLPCLAAWPAGPDGLLAAELPLPVAGEAGLGARLRWWAQLLPADRDLALALVDTLAAAPALLPTQGHEAQRQQLAAQALRLRAKLQRTLNLGRWARRLRQGLRGQRT
jgi:hypothetical protein